MKIKYNPTRIITTADMFIACDPPITFEVKVRISPDWARRLGEWEDAKDQDINIAMQLMSETFISVSQDGEAFLLSDIKSVQELRDSIEQDNKGYGNEFITQIVEMFGTNHFRFLALASQRSTELLRPSNGTAKEKKRVK